MSPDILKSQFDEAIQGNYLTADGMLALDGCRSFSTPSARVVESVEVSESVREILHRLVMPHDEERSSAPAPVLAI